MTNIPFVPTTTPTVRLPFATAGIGAEYMPNGRVTTGTYFDINGLMQLAPAKSPRIDYGPQGQCKGILTEPSTTNRALQSSSPGIAPWVNSAMNVSSDVVMMGVMPFTMVNELATTAKHTIEQTVAVGAENVGAVQFFLLHRNHIDGTNRPVVTARVMASQTNAFFCHIDLRTGAFRTGATGTFSSANSAWEVEKFDSGVIRIQLSYRESAATIAQIASSAASTIAAADNNVASYAGTPAFGFRFGGLQWTTGILSSGKSSYIPTTTAISTRSADLMSLWGQHNITAESLITVRFCSNSIVEGNKTFGHNASGTVLAVRDTDMQAIRLIYSQTGYVTLSQANIAIPGSAVQTISTQCRHKASFGLSDGKFTVAADGNAVTNVVGILTPGQCSILLGRPETSGQGGDFAGHIEEIMIYGSAASFATARNFSAL